MYHSKDKTNLLVINNLNQILNLLRTFVAELQVKEDEIREMVESGMKPTDVVKNGGYF
jgi:hypothetical protein